ncbi:OmpA family protein [Advenella mimigardefordensis]|uniref:Putative outer membrane protein, OmpA family n=1 Tax=Advenella mimigardefordensis (strain DSM 17166 / LMG 22922 / DPN7) TaxID=1247726 RepID=W0PFW3_ADVMD|nr:OmpA family protein [Advenella mimigardefordensis]AHG63953.1 putative outer membrane protein, OmpA family [Advenella mimigardefordensis DPN7]
MRRIYLTRFGRRSVMVLALVMSGAASAQTDDDSNQYILDLVPQVLDLQVASSDLNAATSDLSENAQKLIEENGRISVRKADGGTVLSVASDILFAFDSANLSPKAQATLKDISTIINDSKVKVVKVIGHTDARGSDTYNRKLSKARAESVAVFLVKEGVAQSRIRAQGRGEAEPVAENDIDGKDNPSGRAKNRRVEFVLPR